MKYIKKKEKVEWKYEQGRFESNNEERFQELAISATPRMKPVAAKPSRTR
jgi:hypothetical protein